MVGVGVEKTARGICLLRDEMCLFVMTTLVDQECAHPCVSV